MAGRKVLLDRSQDSWDTQSFHGGNELLGEVVRTEAETGEGCWRSNTAVWYATFPNGVGQPAVSAVLYVYDLTCRGMAGLNDH